jgi:hypothetical protein
MYDTHCNDNCPLKLLYGNIAHVHKIKKSSNYGRDRQHYICIGKNNNMLDKLYQPKGQSSILVENHCSNLDEYAKIRNDLAKKDGKSTVPTYNDSPKYYVQYGKIPSPKITNSNDNSNIVTENPQPQQSPRNKADPDGWVVVKSKKKTRHEKQYGQLL